MKILKTFFITDGKQNYKATYLKDLQKFLKNEYLNNKDKIDNKDYHDGWTDAIQLLIEEIEEQTE